MKKRLLLQLLALLCVVGVYADDGNYRYSSTAKYKVTGTNIFVNGDFTANDAGWTNPSGELFSTDVWGLETEELDLPDGVKGNAIKSKAAKADTLSTLPFVIDGMFSHTKA